ncbi:MAG TPA: bifunctional riboflavin kinase/FAD synthetase [Xanthomonadales bacterium]|nr:bifunctional riboflavin kinase/FAD synthetase [Xanthomonadales bacterium]
MRLKRNRPGLPGSQPYCRSVVTIGNFDGVHRGHQALVARAHECTLPGEQLAVVTFEPLPQAFFRPEQAPARLSTVRQKLVLLSNLRVDLCWMMRFDQLLSQLDAVEFVQQVLLDDLAVRHVVVGEDFRFGHKRAGNLELLVSLGQENGFSVETVAPVLQAGERISSTSIRQALAASDFSEAATMLGRPFRMDGRVVMGQQLGRKLGYPTANLRVGAQPCPIHGIFAVHARRCESGGSQAWLPGVASLGRRPTVGGKELLLEVHLFDFAADLYRQRLQVEFVAKLRDEMHFENVDSMLVHMKRDETQARQILASHSILQSETSQPF